MNGIMRCISVGVLGGVQAGFDYLTDEAAVIDPSSGLLQPYPKWLSMDERSVGVLDGVADHLPPEFPFPIRPFYSVRPRDLRARPIGRPCPIGYVVFPRYDPDHQTDRHQRRRHQHDGPDRIAGNVERFSTGHLASLLATIRG